MNHSTPSRRQPLRMAIAGAMVLSLAAVAGTGMATFATPKPPYSFEKVAELPQAAPGIPGKYLIRDFEINGFNQSGGLLFGADYHSSGFICQPGAGNCPAAEGEGLWVQKPNGSPTLILKTGGLDPDGELLAGAFLGPSSLNNSGDVAVTWPLLPVPPTAPPPAPTPNAGNHARLHAGVYRYNAANGLVSVIAKTGSPAPVGGTFAGASSTTGINGRGDVAFLGITEDPDGTFLYQSPTDTAPRRFGVGVYLADNQNHVVPIAVPGDPAPEGGSFDLARNPALNDRGDVAFDARLAGGPSCLNFGCLTRGIYVRWANSGTTEKLVGVGDVAPIPPLGSVVYKDYLFGPFVNNQGQVIFEGGVDDPYALPLPVAPTPVTRALFFMEDGETTAIVYPGKGITTTGGESFTLWRVSFVAYNHSFANGSAVAFSAQMLGDANGDGVRDSAVFLWQDGAYTLIAKTGDTLPGIGVVREILAPASVATNSQSRPSGGVQLNSRGQVAFHVTLQPAGSNPGPLGVGGLIVATP